MKFFRGLHAKVADWSSWRYTKLVYEDSAVSKKESVKKMTRKHAGKFFVLIFLATVVLPALAFGVYSAVNHQKVYARQFIGQTDLGGKDKDELRKIITDRSEAIAKDGISLKFADNGKTFTIKATDIGFHYNLDATVESVWGVGHGGAVKEAFAEQFRSIFIPTKHEAQYTYNEDMLNTELAEIAKELDLPEKDYYIEYSENIFLLSGNRTPGKRVNREKLIAALRQNLVEMSGIGISFAAEEYQPQVSEVKAKNRLSEANRILEAGELVLEYDTQSFKFDTEMIGGTVKSRAKGDDLELYFSDGRLDPFVDSIAAAVNVDPVNATLSVSNGKVAIFQQAKEGKTVDAAKTKHEIEKALLLRIGDGADIPVPQKISVVVEVKQPEVTESEINRLGITDLVGTAFTSFKGSPVNRVHNIKTGAAALNGVLLTPGETFSTLAKLGEISDKSGYLPELVIKENRTVPEFGGGLCQVSSTMFRSALNAGMKITARQNHKYRVSYYEPPVGMDATIYDPAPDFRFVNTYDSHILIQSKVEGTKITFDLYGTKDSRVVEIGTPEVYDYVDPGPRINIETDTLAPGEEKQLEKPHQGASAKFHYKVAKDGKTIQETDFLSKYVPWPEKWLVGKQAPAVETPAETTAAP